MSIDSQYLGESFTPEAGANAEYTFEFEILDPADVRVVYVFDDDTTVTLAASEYTVVLGALPVNAPPIYARGTVIITEAAPGTVVSVNISRKTPITQLVDYEPYSPFPAETTEYTLDKLTMIAQELGADVGLIKLILDGQAVPVDAPFIPLSGTKVAQSVTGTITFENVGSAGPITIAQEIVPFFGTDAFVIRTEANNSAVLFETKTAAGVSQLSGFTANGQLLLPSVEESNAESWLIGAGNNGFDDNSLIFYAQTAGGAQTNRGLTFSVNAGTNVIMHPDGHVTAGRATVDGDSGTTLATKQWVLDQIAAIP